MLRYDIPYEYTQVPPCHNAACNFPENGHSHSRSTHSLTRIVKRSVALGLPTDAQASFHAHAAPSSIQFGGYTRRLFQSDTVGSYVYPGSSYPAMRDREGKRESQQAREREAEEVSERKVDTIQGSIRSDTGVRGWRWRHHRWLSVEDGSVACRRGAHGRAAAVCRASAGCLRVAGGARGGVVDCSRDAQVHLMLQCSQTAELFVDVCELLLRETCHRHHFV